MNTTEKITRAAEQAGLTATQESMNLVVRDEGGTAVASATIVAGRFYGGWTMDGLGHISSETTARGLVQFVAACA